jgi:hypothetical protein
LVQTFDWQTDERDHVQLQEILHISRLSNLVKMNFQQQQALANAQAMQRGAGMGAAGGITPQQQQQMAMANQMAGQYGGGQYFCSALYPLMKTYSMNLVVVTGITPQQQQQLAMAQQMAAQYGAGK